MAATQHKAIVLDANILIRAVLGTRVRNLLLAHASRVHFFAPQTCFAEAREHLPALLARRGLGAEVALEVLARMETLIQPLELEWLEPCEQVARTRLRDRDEDDCPVLAAALSLSCPVWTEDADFFGVGVSTWTSRHVHEFLSE